MELKKKNFKIFVDFDGTITTRDVGEAMFLEFGDPEEANNIVKDWLEDKITSKDTWNLLCKTVENFDETEFQKFLNEISIDSTFLKFIDYCSENDYDVKILSDGLDYYIERILKREKLNHLGCYSNKLSFGSNNELIPHFPHTDEECDKCANCKRKHIINNSSDDDYTVYIGDGYSDACPAQYCDFIFAKKSLLKYCEVNRISYFPYENFNDVIKRINELNQKKRLKKRHQAELKRREVYLQG
jgi:2,3-diketo-5-methylthio-1-phosphopentane phosphatase